MVNPSIKNNLGSDSICRIYILYILRIKCSLSYLPLARVLHTRTSNIVVAERSTLSEVCLGRTTSRCIQNSWWMVGMFAWQNRLEFIFVILQTDELFNFPQCELEYYSDGFCLPFKGTQPGQWQYIEMKYH